MYKILIGAQKQLNSIYLDFMSVIYNISKNCYLKKKRIIQIKNTLYLLVIILFILFKKYFLSWSYSQISLHFFFSNWI